MEEIVELRFMAMDCHMQALKCHDPLEKDRLTADGMWFTTLADIAVRALPPLPAIDLVDVERR